MAAGQPIIQPPHGFYHPPGAGPAQQIQYLPPQGQPFIRMGPPQGNLGRLYFHLFKGKGIFNIENERRTFHTSLTTLCEFTTREHKFKS